MNTRIQCVDGGTTGTSRLSRPGRAKDRGAVSGAFTLVELLVVIGIIVVLIGILLPAMGAVRNRARMAQTQALMTHLRSNIDAYYTHFSAYPGPFGPMQTSGPGGASKISGAQNLLLGLSYTLTSDSSGNLMLPFTTDPHYVKQGGVPSAVLVNGPMDYAATDPNGNPTQLAPYFEPGPKQTFDFLSNNPAMGFNNTVARLPVVVDAFPDGLPICYYRRTPGVDSQTQLQANVSAGYYFYDNIEYTKPAQTTTDPTSNTPVPYLKASSGAICPGNPDFDSKAFNKLVSVNGTDTGNVRGGYVLISAGIDRWYGARTSLAPKGASDDIVIVGGD